MATTGKHFDCGKYKLVKQDNMDDYLKAIGVGLILRKAVGVAAGHIDLTHNKDTDTYHAKASMGPKSQEFSYKLGVPFEEECMDGRKCKTTIIHEGDDKSIQTQECHADKDKSSVVTRVFKGDEMTATYKCGNAVGTQVWKRES